MFNKRPIGLAIALAVAFFSQTISVRAEEAKPTIVLVHGAWADGSSWDGVVRGLHRYGYVVDVPPNGLRGIASDSSAIAEFLSTISGPVVLVGHSYGGTIITNAAFGNARVKALVYVDAFIPAQHETIAAETAAKPGSILAPALTNPASVFTLRPFPGSPPGVADAYVLPAIFVSEFAAGLPREYAEILATTQRPLATSAIGEPSGPPAWTTIPSWDLIGTEDNVIPPAEQGFMAARAHSTVEKIAAHHLSLISNPDEVTAFIIRAARTVRK
jgi:pimeloyl-ACP methyl ester carboxylesterase